MGEDPPSLHAAHCRVDGCEWGALGFNLPGLYADLGDHMMDEHDYSTDEWHDTLRSLKS